MNVLIVEKNRVAASAFASSIQRELGWHVDIACSESEAVNAFASDVPAIAVVGWNTCRWGFTGLSGLNVCRSMRALSTEVVLIVSTDREAVDERIAAFDAGVDQFLVRPFEPREFAAVARAILRRTSVFGNELQGAPPLRNHNLAFQSIKVDLLRQRTVVDDNEVELSKRQFLLLVYLMDRAGNAVSEHELRAKVLGTLSNVPSSTVRNHIHQLRSKLGPAGRYIRCLPGSGYAIGVQEAKQDHFTKFGAVEPAVQKKMTT